MNFKKTDIGKSTLQYDIVVPKSQVAKKYDETFEKLIKDVTIEGFRKGKTPKKVAEKHIKKDLVYKEVINELISDIYKDLVGKEALKPIVAPKIELIKAKEEEDWEIRITVSQKPQVLLKNYKDLIVKIKREQKVDEIWTPGMGEKTPEQKTSDEEKKRQLLNKVLDAILKNVEVEIADLIIEDELNKRLTALVDDVRKVGLTLENYLKSKGETIEALKEKYKKEIEEIYRLEFGLEEIADMEKITVEKEDLDKLFATITDAAAKEQAEKNSYYYASMLKRQKTLDKLISL